MGLGGEMGDWDRDTEGTMAGSGFVDGGRVRATARERDGFRGR